MEIGFVIIVQLIRINPMFNNYNYNSTMITVTVIITIMLLKILQIKTMDHPARTAGKVASTVKDHSLAL